ncbi:MAG: hypothetical protein EOO75_06115 [Myxococcales bacterium]|nr:MAG: hypothetical protein EOO75_06115 [Myxococcales bacterium]
METDPDAGDYLEEALLEPLGDRIPVHLSEVATGRCLLRASLPGGWGEVDAGRARAWLSLDRGGRRLLRVGGRNVRVYDLERMASRFRGEPRRPRQGDVLRTWLAPRRVSHAVFLPDGEHALAVCGHEMVVWHTGHDEPRATWSAPARIVAWGLSTGGFLAVSDSTGGVRLGRLEGYRASTPIDSRSNGWSPWPFDMTGDEG